MEIYENQVQEGEVHECKNKQENANHQSAYLSLLSRLNTTTWTPVTISLAGSLYRYGTRSQNDAVT